MTSWCHGYQNVLWMNECDKGCRNVICSDRLLLWAQVIIIIFLFVRMSLLPPLYLNDVNVNDFNHLVHISWPNNMMESPQLTRQKDIYRFWQKKNYKPWTVSCTISIRNCIVFVLNRWMYCSTNFRQLTILKPVRVFTVTGRWDVWVKSPDAVRGSRELFLGIPSVERLHGLVKAAAKGYAKVPQIWGTFECLRCCVIQLMLPQSMIEVRL
jgi:hypothetical protein